MNIDLFNYSNKLLSVMIAQADYCFNNSELHKNNLILSICLHAEQNKSILTDIQINNIKSLINNIVYG